MAYTQAHNKANQKYQKKAYDRISLLVRKGKKEEYRQVAQNNGETLMGMITRLLDEEVERNKQ